MITTALFEIITSISYNASKNPSVVAYYKYKVYVGQWTSVLFI